MTDKTLFASAVAVAGTVRAEYKNVQDFLADTFSNIEKLSDAEWDAMDTQVQEWYNECSKQMDAKKPLPSLGEPEDGGGSRRRRRGAAAKKEAAPAASAGAELSVDAITVGMSVKLTTARMEVEGEVSDVKKNVITVKQADGTEKPVAKRRIKAAVSVGGGAPAAADTADEDPPAASGGGSISVENIGEGMSVTLKTKRKEVSGTVKSVGKAAIIVVDANDEEQRVAIRRITEVIDNSTAGPATGADAAVSSEHVMAIRQAIVDDMEANAEDVHEMVQEDGVDVDRSVVHAIHADVHATISLLREADLLAE